MAIIDFYRISRSDTGQFLKLNPRAVCEDSYEWVNERKKSTPIRYHFQDDEFFYWAGFFNNIDSGFYLKKSFFTDNDWYYYSEERRMNINRYMLSLGIQ